MPTNLAPFLTKMTTQPSLFAHKLKAHRARAGQHGRMTQEELADLLGVSVDAISKYERSLSYIRGDFEHRLTEALGWSHDEVIACREDWETVRKQSRETYRLFREHDVIDEIDGTVSGVNAAILKLEESEGVDFPEGYSANDPIWDDILGGGTLAGAYVMHGKTLVGHTALLFPNEDLESQFHSGDLEESVFSRETLKRPILPGEYFAYCPAVYLARFHEAAARPLLTGFVSILEDLVDRDILLRGIGAIAITPTGRQLCKDLGLDHLGPHKVHPKFSFWYLPGKRIAQSLPGRRSAKICRAYGTLSG